MNQIGQRWAWETCVEHVIVEVVDVGANRTEVKIVHLYEINCYRLGCFVYISETNFAECVQFTLLEGQEAPRR